VLATPAIARARGKRIQPWKLVPTDGLPSSARTCSCVARCTTLRTATPASRVCPRNGRRATRPSRISRSLPRRCLRCVHHEPRRLVRRCQSCELRQQNKAVAISATETTGLALTNPLPATKLRPGPISLSVITRGPLGRHPAGSKGRCMWALPTCYTYDVARVNMIACYFFGTARSHLPTDGSPPKLMLPMSTRWI
jgi:hypothetical protein